MLEAEWQENSSTRQLLHGDLGSIPLLRLVLLSEANAAGANGSFHAYHPPPRTGLHSLHEHVFTPSWLAEKICDMQTADSSADREFGFRRHGLPKW
jgi:hypothetical protein